MGINCCNPIRREPHELDLDTSDSYILHNRVEQEGFGKLSKARTMMKRQEKSKIHKCDTNAVGFNPGTFVLETQGLLNSNYDFLCKLGEGKSSLTLGTYGTVHKAMHKCTKEIRAIKMIRRNGTSKDEEKKLREEIKVLKKMVRVV